MPIEDEIKRGEGLAEAGQADEALQVFEAVLREDPSHRTALNDAGVVYYGLKRYDDAVRSFRQALAVEPLDNTAAVNLYNVYVAMRLFDEALDVLKYHQQAFTDEDLDRMQQQIAAFRFEKQPE